MEIIKILIRLKIICGKFWHVIDIQQRAATTIHPNSTILVWKPTHFHYWELVFISHSPVVLFILLWISDLGTQKELDIQPLLDNITFLLLGNSTVTHACVPFPLLLSQDCKLLMAKTVWFIFLSLDVWSSYSVNKYHVL